MYLVYEGPDAVGKTTTRKLVEKQRDGKDVVLDRFIGSNIVYGRVFNRYSKEEISNLYLDDCNFVFTFYPVLIYLYAPAEVLFERIKKDKHKKISVDLLRKTILEYDLYFDRSFCRNKIKINTNQFLQNKVVDQILKFLKDVENK